MTHWENEKDARRSIFLQEQVPQEMRSQMSFWLEQALLEIDRLRAEQKKVAMAAWQGGADRQTWGLVDQNWAFCVSEEPPSFDAWWSKEGEE